MKQFFRIKYQLQSIYQHHQKRCKDGSWEWFWQYILDKYRHLLDISCILLNGTYTSTKRKGQIVSYQGKAKASSRDAFLVCSNLVDGSHNNAFDLVSAIKNMSSIQYRGVVTDRLLQNAERQDSMLKTLGIIVTNNNR